MTALLSEETTPSAILSITVFELISISVVTELLDIDTELDERSSNLPCN
ncbi:MAG: hypothetical protein OCC49_08375 [Fibrobacterales bacterium]